ncbi:MAG: hypothetical protein K1V97_03435, partial [Lachnospiraceae bacterium]
MHFTIRRDSPGTLSVCGAMGVYSYGLFGVVAVRRFSHGKRTSVISLAPKRKAEMNRLSCSIRVNSLCILQNV